MRQMKDRLLILNLEDSEKDSELIEAQLSDGGLDCDLVRVEKEADFSSALENNRFDLILADYSLPSFDGFSALKIALEKRPDVPFIFVSGAIGEDFAVEMLKSGATDYILKNRMSRLAPAAKRALQAAKERADRRRAEVALKEYREHLEHLVEKRTAELTESERRYRLLFEKASDAILIMDAEGEEGKIVDANEAAAKMHGYSLAELLKLNIGDVDSPEEAGRHSERRGLMLKGQWVKAELTHCRKDGTIFLVEISANVFEQDGRKYIIAIERDITERKKAEEQIKWSLREKEILLKEVHHRVKNNLQVVSSLLGLQSAYITDKEAKRSLEKSRQRVESMSIIHEKLYQSKDLARIDFKEYMESVVSNLITLNNSPNKEVKIILDIEGISLDISRSIPCGLVLNELITNSLKHAFTDGREGEIVIGMRCNESGRISLTVSDNGIGFPDRVDFRKTKSLGMQLVIALIKQIDGVIDMEACAGTCFRIAFQA